MFEPMNVTQMSVSQPGLADPVHQSQEIFRTILTALSEPGRIMQVSFQPVADLTTGAAALAVLLCLADGDTPLWLGATANTLAAYLRFHTGAPVVADPRDAHFALIANQADFRPLAQFDPGTEDYPDRSTTLIIEVEALDEGGPIGLRGPGIPDHRHLTMHGLPPAFAAQWAANHAQFPCGVDVILTCGTRLIGLPRSTILEASCM
jgi:alpha-D-ribose 1-methylphosphonate 5-triphosphate synthase subunit PhnH